MVHSTLAYQDQENVMARADRLDTLIGGRYSIGMGGRFRPSSKDTKKKSHCFEGDLMSLDASGRRIAQPLTLRRSKESFPDRW